MQKIFATIGLVIFVLLSSSAQDVAPVPAPPDVALKLGTEADVHRFHLGELIPTTFSYSASIPGRYIWVTRSSTLAGGRSVEITCKPAAEPVSGIPKSGPDLTFAQILIAPCGGVGGSAFGACADCDGEYLLTEKPLAFGVVPMNEYVRFCTPGTYICQASSAQVTSASRNEKIRPALLVKSNPITLTLVDDPLGHTPLSLQTPAPTRGSAAAMMLHRAISWNVPMWPGASPTSTPWSRLLKK
jgi:hypothetical protein